MPLTPSRRAALPAALILALAAGLPTPSASADTFAQIVKAHAAQWDADSDGILTPAEVDRLVIDKSLKGEHAAAVAALKIAMRAKDNALKSVTLASIDAIAKKPLDADFDREAMGDLPDSTSPNTKSTDPQPSPSPVPTPGTTPAKKPATLDILYARCTKAIAGTPHELFVHEAPSIDSMHQGRVGVCYINSAIGALTFRDSRAIAKMITVKPTGGYVVSFPGRPAVEIDALTDAEIPLYSPAAGEGLWLPVVQKAIATIRMAQRPESQRKLSVSDCIANGGRVAASIELLTGHKAERTVVKDIKGGTDAIHDKIRAAIIAGLRDGKLVGTGTGKEKTPPGVPGNHAYAIIGFDKATDMVEMWNPHGSNHTPKGEPGIANGYTVKRGTFKVPLADFVQIFKAVSVETDTPAPGVVSDPDADSE